MRSRSRSPIRERRKKKEEGSSRRRREEEEEEEKDRGSSRRKKDEGRRREREEDEEAEVEEEISEEDYYRKNSEFRLWLLEHKDKYFDELDKVKQKKYFTKFVDKWNSGSLKSKFYDGIRSSQIPRNDSTRHKWNFSSKLNEHEMDRIRDSVDSATYSNRNSNLVAPSTASSSSTINPTRRVLGPQLPSSRGSGASGFELEVDQEDLRRRQRLDQKRETKAYRKNQELVMEELVPKATGREAVLEKRREKASYTRRERSPDVVLNDSDLLGTDDFQSALAREKARDAQRSTRRQNFQQERANEMSEKVAQHRAKEDATLAMFRQMAAAHHPAPSRPPPPP